MGRMNSKLRKSDFKLGSIHGKIKPKAENSEAMIQRNVYLSQSIKIKRSNDDKKRRKSCKRWKEWQGDVDRAAKTRQQFQDGSALYLYENR